MKAIVNSIVAVCIGFKHMGTHIGVPEWLEGKVVREGPSDAEVKAGIAIDGEIVVSVKIEPTLHGRTVDAEGNLLISDQERKAQVITRTVYPADDQIPIHDTWRPAPQDVARARQSAMDLRKEQLAAREEAARKKLASEAAKAEAAITPAQRKKAELDAKRSAVADKRASVVDDAALKETLSSLDPEV